MSGIETPEPEVSYNGEVPRLQEGGVNWLVVEDDPHVARAIERILTKYGYVWRAANLAAAFTRIEAFSDYTGLVLDVKLPDGSGLDALREFRARGCEAPALVMTAHNDRENINTAQLLGAQFLWKPWSNENLRTFVDHALDWRAARSDLRTCLAQLVERHALSSRETEVVRLVTVGWPVEALAGMMDVSENTIKTTIRRLLQKTSAKSVAELARGLHRQLLNPRQ
ncbi:MAG: response regulator transcription factor [Deltaproteobacteria bacterium]|nr:response regulator transcription factor [Deltaproteobacteria bacterium]